MGKGKKFSLIDVLREGFNKIIKKSMEFSIGVGVPPDFGSVSILFFYF